MNDGSFTYYKIQHRKTAESEWSPGSKSLKLKSVPKKNDWCDSCGDFFGFTGDSYIRSNTGVTGWQQIADAASVLKLLRKADAAGKFDSQGDSAFARSGTKNQLIRHEYRVVRIMVMQASIPELI